MKQLETEILFDTDFCVIGNEGKPLRYSNNEIGLWDKEAIKNREIVLKEGEKFIPSTDLVEPYRKELINQLRIHN